MQNSCDRFRFIGGWHLLCWTTYQLLWIVTEKCRSLSSWKKTVSSVKTILSSHLIHKVRGLLHSNTILQKGQGEYKIIVIWSYMSLSPEENVHSSLAVCSPAASKLDFYAVRSCNVSLSLHAPFCLAKSLTSWQSLTTWEGGSSGHSVQLWLELFLWYSTLSHFCRFQQPVSQSHRGTLQLARVKGLGCI